MIDSRSMHVPAQRKGWMFAGALACAAATSGWAQPTPAPLTGDLPCAEEPTANPPVVPDATPDANGWYSMFNGTFKGLFQSCKTGHSVGSNQGAIFRIGTLADGKKAIYTTQRSGTIGGVLMTNKKFKNYEIRFQTWPDFGNDAGIFNRTPMNGRCYQTTLDYIGGAAMGGVWGEGGFVGRDFRPFAFQGTESAISIPGNNAGTKSNWTAFTRAYKVTHPGLPCPTNGCTQADWNLLWDKDGWNDIRIEFFGGYAAGTGSIRMNSWFKKPSSTKWIPLLQDTLPNVIAPENRIGIQVHGGGRFGGPKGTWYKGLKYRELTDKGAPAAAAAKSGAEALGLEDAGEGLPVRFSASATHLTGMMDRDYAVSVSDAQGRIVERFQGKAGRVDHAFASSARGLLFVRVATAQGTETYRVLRAR